MKPDHEAQQKISADHLRRDAFLYIRQSSLQQVFNNAESTKRQYALRQRAVTLGWPHERVHVIDSDLGQSGASAVDRLGFQKLVAEVGMGHAGIVLGLEVSRLARNSTDWHRLLEICALSDTLILDEDGLYDPSHFNDRLLLGLKGTMSEAELHVLKARLQGGIRNKARRGELRIALPIGLAYDQIDRVVLDPDCQVQDTIRLFFQEYQRLGSASGVVRHFNRQKILFPRRLRKHEYTGRFTWGTLSHTQSLHVLHNPRYAGAFVFGRTKVGRCKNGRIGPRPQPQEAWQVLLPNNHPGYITWQQYLDNLKCLRTNAQALGQDRRRSPPQQGPALLQGLVLCGKCGHRMTVRYHDRYRTLVGDYVCQRERIEHDGNMCQQIPGRDIDHAIGALVLEKIRPETIELSFAVQREIQVRQDEVDHLRSKHIERARYESDIARERFMRVDPQNRLVADTLEGDWNMKIRALNEAQENVEQQRKQDVAILDDQTRQAVLKLSQDLPALWGDPRVSDQDRKRMLRLLIEDVTVTRGTDILVQVRFKAGATTTLHRPLPKTAWEQRETRPDVIARIDDLLNYHTDSGVAKVLNQEGLVSGMKLEFTRIIVRRLRREYKLVSTRERLLRRGLMTLKEISHFLGVSKHTVIVWRKNGLIVGHPYNDRDDFLYEMPSKDQIPRKSQGLKLSERAQATKVPFHPSNEVHHAS